MILVVSEAHGQGGSLKFATSQQAVSQLWSSIQTGTETGPWHFFSLPPDLPAFSVECTRAPSGITAVFLQLFTSRRERQEESHLPSNAGGVAPHLCRSQDSQSSSDRTRPHAMLWTEHGSKFAVIQFYWHQIILHSSIHSEPLYSLDPCTVVHCLFISQRWHMTFPNTQCPEALQKQKIRFLSICTMSFLAFTPLFK